MTTPVSSIRRRLLRLDLIVLILGGFLFAVALPAGLQAQTGQAADEPAAADQKSTGTTAPVEVDGTELFMLRGSSALPAKQRAARVRQRIIDVAESRSVPFMKMEVRPTPLGPGIFADDVQITTVTAAESEMEQMELEIVVDLQLGAIQDAILAYRAARTSKARVDSAIEVGLWSTGFALFTVLMIVGRRRLRKTISRLVHRYFASLESVTNAQVQAKAIAALIHFAVDVILLATFFLGFYYFLSLVLLAIPETRAIAQLLLIYITEPVLEVLLGLIGFIPNFVTIAVIVVLARYVIKGLRVFFDAVEAGTFELGSFEPHWVGPTFSILRVLVILTALVFAFPYIPGSDSAAFKGLTILLGAMLSLGANSVVGNILSGLFVIYRRSTSIGDRIRIGEHVGDVVDIKMMETHLKSIKNELISIPNAQLLNSEVVNYSKQSGSGGLLLHTTVGIGYEEPPERVEAMLIEAARRTTGLKKRPEPFVLWMALGDFSISYQINAYSTQGAAIPKITSDLHRNIMAVFTENGVQIMTPSYVADPPDPKVPPHDWDGRLEQDG